MGCVWHDAPDEALMLTRCPIRPHLTTLWNIRLFLHHVASPKQNGSTTPTPNAVLSMLTMSPVSSSPTNALSRLSLQAASKSTPPIRASGQSPYTDTRMTCWHYPQRRTSSSVVRKMELFVSGISTLAVAHTFLVATNMVLATSV